MHTDRRIYFTTAIVAVVVGLAISFMARSGPLTTALGAPPMESRTPAANVLREAQTTESKAVQDQPAANWLDFERTPLPPENVRVARLDSLL